MELAERNILSILSVILPVLSLLVPLFFLKHANYPQIGMYQWLVLIAIIIVPFFLLRKFFPPPPSGKVCGHLELWHNFGK